MIRVILLTLFIANSVVAVCGQDNAGRNKRVLLFFNNDSFTATQIEMERAVRATLKSDPNVPVELYSEYVGNTRTGTDYEDEFVDLMSRKYEGKKFDVIFAFTNAPLNILLRNRQEMFPETPIVFITLDQRDVQTADLRTNATAISGKINFKRNLELALAQYPATKRVVLIGGLSVTDKYWGERAEQDFQEFTSRVEFIKLTGLSVPEMRKELSSLPPDTLVFFVTTVLDHLGNTYESPDYLRQIATASNAPIYGTTDAQLGNGIVGGWLVSFNSLGIEGGRVGLRLLAGEKVQDIPPRVIADRPLFDWRELQRWNISESSLPEGSVIQFRQPSLWEEYKWYVIGLSAAVIVEAILIALLLYLRLRRRQAERENARLSGRLAEIVSNVPGIVWESRTDPAVNGRRTTFVSDYAKRMLGYTPDEWLTQPPGFGLQIIPEEERERVLQEMDQVVETGKEAVSEFRWFTKEGRIRWVENYIAPIVDNGNGIVGLRGVALDVTDRKVAEKKARDVEEKDRAILAAIPDLMFIQTADGIYLDYHAKDPSELLVSPESFLGKNMSEVLPADLASKLAECFARVKEKGEPEILEYSLDTGEGPKWFEARMVRSGDKILSVIRDITDRVNALDELVRSEERFGKAFRANPQPMSITTVADGRFIDVNDAFLSVSGYTREDVIGRTAAEVELWRSPDDREKFVTAIQTNGSVVNLETEFRAKNGELRQLLMSAERVQLGGEDCFLIASTDITERHAAQQALQESEARLLLAHQASRMGAFEWNIQANTNTWSTELEEMYGLAPGSFGGTQTAWEDLIHPDDRAKALSIVQTALETGEPAEVEWRVIWPDGSIHWILGRCQAFRDAAGKPLRLAGINIDVSERKAAEEALRESESFNRAILSSLNTHVCVLAGDGRIISVNHSWAAFALDNGLSSEASVGPGVNYFDVCGRAAKEGDELAQFALDGVRAVCDGTQEYFQLEYPCHSPDEKRWFLMIVTRLKGSKGGAVVVHNDITGSKLAAEAVRESEKRFRNMAETAPVMIWMSDEKQATTYVNKRWLELTGSTLEREIGLGWSTHVHPDDVNTTVEYYTAAFDERVPFELEFRVKRTDGEYRWVFTAGTPRFSPDDEFLGYIGTAIDITERKLAEERLKLSERRLRMAQHAARVGTWEWEIETGASVWSEMIWELLGLEPSDQDITVETFAAFIHPEDRDRALQKVNEVIADGVEYEDEFRIIRRDGGILWLASKGALIRSDDGKPERILGVNIDITELKRTQLEAQEISGRLISAQEHERARLARELHDDACQNLALLSIELELLGRVPLTEADTIRSNISILSARVGELSDDLRQMSHQLHPARLTRLGLGSALRGFCNEIESAHALKVEFVEDNIPAVLPAPTSLNVYRIVQESLQNVVKHSGATRASVTLSAKGEVLQLSVSDNGCGFDPKIATPNGSLGLISIRERVRLLRGEVSIDSRPGSITRIKVAIPIKQN